MLQLFMSTTSESAVHDMQYCIEEYTFENLQALDEKVKESDVPVLLDFYADWCGPCVAFFPVLKEVASQYKGKVRFFKINVDNSPQLTSSFGVMSIPTLVLIASSSKDTMAGTSFRMIAQKGGGMSKEALCQWLDENIQK